MNNERIAKINYCLLTIVHNKTNTNIIHHSSFIIHYNLVLLFLLLYIIMDNTTLFIGAGLAIGLAGLGVGIWEGLIAKKSLQIMGKNPEMSGSFLVLTVLGIALTESAAIYGLIIALQIMWLDPATVSSGAVIGAGLAVGAAGFGSGVGEWFLVCGAMDAILRNPETKGKIMTYMILFLALVESSAIYGLVVALSLLG